MKFVEIALPTPIRSTFTYKNPFSYSLLGKRVVVPFGRRTLIGLVMTESYETSSSFKLKEIAEILDDQPLFTKQLLNSISNLSDYYFHPIGEVAHAFIPNLLRKRHNTQFLKKYDALHITHLPAEPKLVKLTKEQAQCLDSINKSQNKEFLLFGVTSSGKTEVYKHYIKQMLQKNKSSLVMVPEIFLTPQVFESFQKDFGEQVHVFHS
ncbi:MAG: DEAD/DEAH box helicase family protein, partial [Proteobacteria bacterium]|nr:DEAD/DEAH box helicase family protein [Pseudomonadota bacterium]